jgi:hypothetical protein
MGYRQGQDDEQNRATNYRAFLAMTDGREKDQYHLDELNKVLNVPVKSPAWKTRCDKFEASYKRSQDNDCIADFLHEAFDGQYHGKIRGKDCIWKRY